MALVKHRFMRNAVKHDQGARLVRAVLVIARSHIGILLLINLVFVISTPKRPPKFLVARAFFCPDVVASVIRFIPDILITLPHLEIRLG